MNNGYYCECGALVREEMKPEVSTMAEVINPSGQAGARMTCPCGRSRLVTYEEILAPPEKWILQE